MFGLFYLFTVSRIMIQFGVINIFIGYYDILMMRIYFFYGIFFFSFLFSSVRQFFFIDFLALYSHFMHMRFMRYLFRVCDLGYLVCVIIFYFGLMMWLFDEDIVMDHNLFYFFLISSQYSWTIYNDSSITWLSPLQVLLTVIFMLILHSTYWFTYPTFYWDCFEFDTLFFDFSNTFIAIFHDFY